jgi:hypothetical protein
MADDPTAGIPRQTVETTASGEIMALLRGLRTDVDSALRIATLRNASISGGDGLRVLDSTGTTRMWMRGDGGAYVALDNTGAEVARMGALANVDVGQYGLEVNVSGTWVHVGAQVATWGNLSGKPSTFPPSAHTHPGSDITSAVSNASNASQASHAADADGSSYGFANTVSGTTFYALWVGNDGGYHIGRNTSALKYKTNVRDIALDPAGIDQLRAVIYDRKDTVGAQPTDEYGNPVEGPAPIVPGAKDEFGMIADEVALVYPEMVTYFNGEIDGLRYDLLSVIELEAIQDLRRRMATAEHRLDDIESRLNALDGKTPA